jgi:hypothetical protein
MPITAPPVDVKSLIAEYAKKYDIPADTADRWIKQESSYNPEATSYKTKNGVYIRDAQGKKIPLAHGLGQLTDPIIKKYGVKNPHDPRENLEASFKYLSDLKKEHGDLESAFAAYNGGPGAVKYFKKRGGMFHDPSMPAESWANQTGGYVKNIMGSDNKDNIVTDVTKPQLAKVSKTNLVDDIFNTIKSVTPNLAQKIESPINKTMNLGNRGSQFTSENIPDNRNIVDKLIFPQAAASAGSAGGPDILDAASAIGQTANAPYSSETDINPLEALKRNAIAAPVGALTATPELGLQVYSGGAGLINNELLAAKRRQEADLLLKEQQNPYAELSSKATLAEEIPFLPTATLDNMQVPFTGKAVKDIRQEGPLGYLAGSLFGLDKGFKLFNKGLDAAKLTSKGRAAAQAGLLGGADLGLQTQEQEEAGLPPTPRSLARAAFWGGTGAAFELVVPGIKASEEAFGSLVNNFKNSPNKVKELPNLIGSIAGNLGTWGKAFSEEASKVVLPAEIEQSASQFMKTINNAGEAEGSVGAARIKLNVDKLAYEKKIQDVNQNIVQLKKTKEVGKQATKQLKKLYGSASVDVVDQLQELKKSFASGDYEEQLKNAKVLLQNKAFGDSAKEDLQFEIAKLGTLTKKQNAISKILGQIEIAPPQSPVLDVTGNIDPATLKAGGVLQTPPKVLGRQEDLAATLFKQSEPTSNLISEGQVQVQEIKSAERTRARLENSIRKLNLQLDDMQTNIEGLSQEQFNVARAGLQDLVDFDTLKATPEDVAAIEKQVNILERRLSSFKGEKVTGRGRTVQPDQLEQKQQELDSLIDSYSKGLNNFLFREEITGEPALYKSAVKESYSHWKDALKLAQGINKKDVIKYGKETLNAFQNPLDILKTMDNTGIKDAGLVHEYATNAASRVHAGTADFLYPHESEWKRLGWAKGTTKDKVIFRILDQIPDYEFNAENLEKNLQDFPAFIAKYSAGANDWENTTLSSGRQRAMLKKGVVDKVIDFDKGLVTKDDMREIAKMKQSSETLSNLDGLKLTERREKYIAHKILNWDGATLKDDLLKKLEKNFQVAKGFERETRKFYLKNFTGAAEDIVDSAMEAFEARAAGSFFNRNADGLLQTIINTIDHPQYDKRLEPALYALLDSIAGKAAFNGLAADSAALVNHLNRNVVASSLNTGAFFALNVTGGNLAFSKFLSNAKFGEDWVKTTSDPGLVTAGMRTLRRMGIFRGGADDIVEMVAGPKPYLGEPGALGKMGKAMQYAVEPQARALADLYQQMVPSAVRRGIATATNYPMITFSESLLKGGVGLGSIINKYGEKAPEIFALLQDGRTAKNAKLFDEVSNVVYKELNSSLNTKHMFAPQAVRAGLGIASTYNSTTGKILFEAYDMYKNNPQAFRNFYSSLIAFGGVNAGIPFISSLNGISKALGGKDLIDQAELERMNQDLQSGRSLHPLMLAGAANSVADLGQGEKLSIDFAPAFANVVRDFEFVNKKMQDASWLERAVWVSEHLPLKNTPLGTISPSIAKSLYTYFAGDSTSKNPIEQLPSSQTDYIPIYGNRSKRMIKIHTEDLMKKVAIKLKLGRGQQQLKRFADSVDDVATSAQEHASKEVEIANIVALGEAGHPELINYRKLEQLKLQERQIKDYSDDALLQTSQAWSDIVGIKGDSEMNLADPSLANDPAIKEALKQSGKEEFTAKLLENYKNSKKYWITQKMTTLKEQAQSLESKLSKATSLKQITELQSQLDVIVATGNLLGNDNGLSFEEKLENFDEEPQWEF